MATRLTRTLTVFAGLLIGGIILASFIATRQGPPESDEALQKPAVRFIEATPIRPTLQATGFGTVQSARPWAAIANVSGRVVSRHAGLENGEFIEAGTELLVIDPSRYELALEQANADLKGIEAERRELLQEQQNTEALYELERQRLALAERELSRAESLANRDMLSANQLDTQRRATIQQRQSTQTLANQLAQIPVKLDRLAARREQAEVRRELAREDLADTRITAPFDMRIGKVEVESGQQVSRGQRLFVADGIQVAEAPIQISFAHMRDLVAGLGENALTLKGPVPSTEALSGIDVRILTGSGERASWDARIVRVAEGLDLATRTLQVITAIDQPYRNAQPPRRPALVPGTFVEGRFTVATSESRLVVPVEAVHQGQVYLVDEQDRLERRDVRTSRPQNGWVIVETGVKPGDRVIIDDPVPAIDGMALRPRHDPDAQKALVEMATGETT
ncbi:efflux RND transporter periplasmic adaptor subunit [Guyparkeria hydrothermalis]|uniref:efflux RND transporter periplasmic adaptor subunit n=1 Tax=Guyparkeria hydrothermalis TaxID=923 RepID=UPI002021253E|nr:efflux RND transporter periplasmic adaptor subunit [Guyparkeria hydrothermalis]MCL7744373.1 efflux RND transporter periplasmic adaptor subunit [Guyparkeria hydrothermalis]